MDDIKIKCNRCEEHVSSEALATHPCVTPRDRALAALDRAAADAATIAAHARSVTEALPSATWRNVARMARDAKAESARVSVAIGAARILAREAAK